MSKVSKIHTTIYLTKENLKRIKLASVELDVPVYFLLIRSFELLLEGYPREIEKIQREYKKLRK